MREKITIATRTSDLAIWQTRFVQQSLLRAHPHLKIDFLPIITQGDKELEKSLADIGGKGLFIKELEQAMLNGEADIAVHSIKDMPVVMPTGFSLAAILERGNPTDALICRHVSGLNQLPQAAKIGTSSPRRASQLLALKPDLSIIPIRGNVPTRIKKLHSENLDAIVLATAGLERLGMEKHITEKLDILPAIGQGAIGIECRIEDSRVMDLIQPLNHLPSASAIKAERKLGEILEASCHSSIAAFAKIHGVNLEFTALVGNAQGDIILKTSNTGSIEQAEKLGQTAAQQLLQKGAKELLC